MKTDSFIRRIVLLSLFGMFLLPAAAQKRTGNYSIVGNRNEVSIDHGVNMAITGKENPGLTVIGTRIQYTRYVTDNWGLRTGIGVTERVLGSRVYFIPLKACVRWDAAQRESFLSGVPLNFEVNAGMNLGWAGIASIDQRPVLLPTEEYFLLDRKFFASLEAGARIGYSIMEFLKVFGDVSVYYSPTRNYRYYSGTTPQNGYKPSCFGYLSGGLAIVF